MPRLTEQYVTETDLNTIKGLTHYLNDTLGRSSGLSVDVSITDSNGERVGVVKVAPGADVGYAFHYLVEDPS